MSRSKDAALRIENGKALDVRIAGGHQQGVILAAHLLVLMAAKVEGTGNATMRCRLKDCLMLLHFLLLPSYKL